MKANIRKSITDYYPILELISESDIENVAISSFIEKINQDITIKEIEPIYFNNRPESTTRTT